METTDAAHTARDIGTIMANRLDELRGRFPHIGEIRGRGAMMAIELVQPGNAEPASALAADVNQYCHAHGVITLVTGSFGNVIRFLPPLTIPTNLLHEGLDVVGDALVGAVTQARP